MWNQAACGGPLCGWRGGAIGGAPADVECGRLLPLLLHAPGRRSRPRESAPTAWRHDPARRTVDPKLTVSPPGWEIGETSGGDTCLIDRMTPQGRPLRILPDTKSIKELCG